MATVGFRAWIAWGSNPASGEPELSAWTECTADVQTLKIRAGRSIDFDRVESSVAFITLMNLAGKYTPENTASTLSPSVRPWAQVKIEWTNDTTKTPFTLGLSRLAAVSATLYTVAPTSNVFFRGLVQRITPEWWNPTGGVCIIQAADLFAYLSHLTLDGTSYSAQTVGARISAVLTQHTCPFPVSIDSTGVTIAASTPVGNLLDYLRDVAFQDGGLLRSRGDGKIAFESLRTLRAADRNHAIQATIGDGAGEINYTDIQLSMDDSLIINKVTGSTSSAVAITPLTDSESQTRYLLRLRDFGQTDIVGTSDLEYRALVELVSFERPRLRIDDLKFFMLDPSIDSDTLSGLDIYDRVRVIRRPDVGDTLNREYIVQGWTDDVSPGEWTRSLKLSNAPSAAFILGEAILGDTAVL